MKKISEISWQVPEEVYRADPSISYSNMSRYDREGWRKIGSLFDKIEGPALRFGSAVDALLTDGEEAYNNRFVVCEFPSLSDALIDITKGLFNRYGNQYRSIDMIKDEDILEHCMLYQTAWGNEAKLRNIRTKCGNYYNLLSLALGKEILSQKDHDDVLSCVNELRNNRFTKGFFHSNPFNTVFEKVFQLKFKAEYNGMPVRCMFDELIVDHIAKVIYPVDLKTTGHPEERFDESFITWRYFIQAQLYTYILQQVISKDEYFKDFKIAHYSFVVINRFTLAPLVWRYYENFSEVDLVDVNGNVYRNWRKLLTEINYYLQSPNTKYTKEALERNGIMRLNNLRAV